MSVWSTKVRLKIYPVFVGVAALIFLVLALGVWQETDFAWDASLMKSIHERRTDGLDSLMKNVTRTGETQVAGMATLVVLWQRRRERVAALILAVTIGGMVMLNSRLKIVFERPRPDFFTPLTPAGGYSFPSGHTSVAIVVYGLLAVWLWRREQYGLAMLVSGWVGLVGLSRVYLGVHFPSDVLGSITLGVVWIATMLNLYDWVKRRQRQLIAENVTPGETKTG